MERAFISPLWIQQKRFGHVYDLYLRSKLDTHIKGLNRLKRLFGIFFFVSFQVSPPIWTSRTVDPSGPLVFDRGGTTGILSPGPRERAQPEPRPQTPAEF